MTVIFEGKENEVPSLGELVDNVPGRLATLPVLLPTLALLDEGDTLLLAFLTSSD